MAKRIFQGLVLFFAVYAFAFVPLGKKTALEHVQAIFGSPEAHDAAEEVKGGVTRLVRRLRDSSREATEDAERWQEEQAGHEDAEDDAAPTPPRRTPKPTKLRAMSAEAPK
jgi:hypothetical protein